jgi:hypothetical protein
MLIVRTDAVIHPPWYAIILVLGVQFIQVTFFLSAYPYVKKKFVRKLRVNDFGLCFECAYDLRGLNNEHICPECGAVFETEELKRNWLRWIGASERRQ